LGELAFQNNPAWCDIDKGYRLVLELKDIHDRTIGELASRTCRFPIRPMSTLLRRGSIVLSQSLLIMDEIALRFHVRQ
jgi:hypothetical protein